MGSCLSAAVPSARMFAAGCQRDWEALPRPDLPLTVGLDGGYRPATGRLLWNEVDMPALDVAAVRRMVAVLCQDFCRYFLDVRENIGVGRHERIRDFEAIMAAADQAGAHAFIQELPQAYETLLGPEFEGGHNLSVGQWQRVALARAFLRDAPFIILDEPTAALHAGAEHEPFDSIRTLFRGRTVLLISHRFSSVRSGSDLRLAPRRAS
jgi:ATP-binding cassette, subfamily B, bacterial